MAGWVRLGVLMRYVSRSVVTGLVNALAIRHRSDKNRECVGQGVANIATDGFDLLVMGACSHSPWRSMFLGSKTSDLLRAVAVPTLLLR